MAKKYVVFITKTAHKDQPFTVRIEGGKTDEILSQRYIDVKGAVRGAQRKIAEAWLNPVEFRITGVLPRKGDKCITPSGMEGTCTGRDTTNKRAGITVSEGYTTTWVKNLKKLTIIRK
jgi:hypothetical protein